MINRVVLIGRLTKDPELRTTQSGISVASFILAVDRNYKNKDGSRSTDFVNCVMWRKAAEIFCNYTYKGSKVGIEGRLQTRQYKSKNGDTVFVTEVVVDNFTFLDSRKDSGQQANNQSQQSNQQQSNQDPFNSQVGSIDISDDDMPF